MKPLASYAGRLGLSWFSLTPAYFQFASSRFQAFSTVSQLFVDLTAVFSSVRTLVGPDVSRSFIDLKSQVLLVEGS